MIWHKNYWLPLRLHDKLEHYHPWGFTGNLKWASIHGSFITWSLNIIAALKIWSCFLSMMSSSVIVFCCFDSASLCLHYLLPLCFFPLPTLLLSNSSFMSLIQTLQRERSWRFSHLLARMEPLVCAHDPVTWMWSSLYVLDNLQKAFCGSSTNFWETSKTASALSVTLHIISIMLNL